MVASLASRSDAVSTPVEPEGDSSAEQLALALARAASREMGIGELIDCAVRLSAQGGPALACTLYKTWIAHNADNRGLYAIYFNYGVCLAESQDIAGSVNVLREATRLKPDFAPPYINLGGMLERLGQTGAAVEAWLALANSMPGVTGEAVGHKLLALKQVGRVLEAASRDDSAEDALRQSLELDPSQKDVAQHIIGLRQRQCKWPPMLGGGRFTDVTLRAAISPLSAACYADDPLFQLANAFHYVRRTVGAPAKPKAARLEAVPAAQPGRRLRIGYVSSDLRNHAVGFAMTDVVETHDRSRVEVFAYYCGIAQVDPTQERIRQAADHWTDLNGLDDHEAAQAIRRDGIDVLVDLNGYTKDARTKVFALRPAPVNVNWFGFPGTMGSPYHHYIVADAHTIPPGSEGYYSETVMRLPCYQPNDRKRVVSTTPATRAEAGLPEGVVVFSCLNGMQKVTSRMFAHWMTILRQVPDSVLWLLSGAGDGTNERLQAAALSHGIAPSRLVFADKRHNPDHLARMPLADLFLDTFPYGAHTTASDALWMGLPVLTLQGRSFASRVCSSLLHAAGVPELICRDAASYVARAVALANDRGELQALRDRLIAGRHTSTLFDTAGLVRALEDRLFEMQAAGLRGALPRPDLANLDVYHEVAAGHELEALEGLSDAAYAQHYRNGLAELDEAFPVRPDSRLWPAPGGEARQSSATT